MIYVFFCTTLKIKDQVDLTEKAIILPKTTFKIWVAKI